MALNIIDGEITPITGLTWNGKQVFQMQTIIPSISNGQSIPLGIGVNRDRTTYRISGSFIEIYKLGVRRDTADFNSLRLENIDPKITRITGTYTYGSNTGNFNTDNVQDIPIQPVGTLLTLTNLVITLLDMTTIEENEVLITTKNGNNQETVKSLRQGAIQFPTVGNTYSFEKMYISNNGELVADESSVYTFEDIFVQIQYTNN